MVACKTETTSASLSCSDTAPMGRSVCAPLERSAFKNLVLSAFQPAPIDTRPPAPYAHTERKPYAAYLCIAYRPPALIPLSRRLSAGLFSYLHKQANGTHTLKSRRGYVPAAGAFRLPGHLQGNVMPPIGEQGSKPLPGVYAFPSKSRRGCGSSSSGLGSCSCAILSLPQLITGPSFLNRHSGPSRR